MNPFVVPTLTEADSYEQALSLLGEAHRAAEICALTGLGADTVKGIVSDPRGTRAAILRARAPKPAAAAEPVRARAAVDGAPRRRPAAARVAIAGAVTPGRILEDADTTYGPPLRGVPEPPRREPDPVVVEVAAPVPPAAHIPAETLRAFLARGGSIAAQVDELLDDIRAALEAAKVPVAEPAPEVAKERTPRTYSDAARAGFRVRGLKLAHLNGHHATNPKPDCPSCTGATA